MAEAQKILELLDQGLSHYGLGEVKEALECWQQVLALDPQNARAREYINFVTSNWGPRERQSAAVEKAPAKYEPVSPSVFSQPPLTASAPIATEPPMASPSSVYKAPAPPPPAKSGWGELFGQGLDFEETVEAADHVAPAAQPAAALAPQKAPTRVAVMGSSTLPPHPPQPLVYQEEPTVEDTKTPAPWPFAQATTPYQVVPTKVGTAPSASAGSDVLDLVAPAPAVPESSATEDVDRLFRGAEDLLRMDDFSGALELLDKILALRPDDQQALQMQRRAREQLGAMLRSKIGPLSRTPRVSMKSEDIIWLNLDHRAGFLLSLIDGRTSYEDIISVCGLEELDALRIFAQLLQEKVIENL